MYEDFNQKARELLIQSELEAAYFGYRQFAPEHLLLAMARAEPASYIASNVLYNEGISYPKLLRAVVDFGVTNRSRMPNLDLSPDPFSKIVIDHARKSAQELGHDYRGAEHLLIGLARLKIGEGNLPPILRRLKISGKKLEGTVKELLGYG